MEEKQNVSYPQPNCPDCGSPLRLIVNENDWYCDSCKKFPKVNSNVPSTIKHGTKGGMKKFWLYYIVVIVIVLIWFIFNCLGSKDSFERNVYTIGIIVLIIAIPISILLTKFVLFKR